MRLPAVSSLRRPSGPRLSQVRGHRTHRRTPASRIQRLPQPILEWDAGRCYPWRAPLGATDFMESPVLRRAQAGRMRQLMARCGVDRLTKEGAASKPPPAHRPALPRPTRGAKAPASTSARPALGPPSHLSRRMRSRTPGHRAMLGTERIEPAFRHGRRPPASRGTHIHGTASVRTARVRDLVTAAALVTAV